jgi:3-oxoacyl-[acyl-carrier-protein] synthase II
MQGNLEVVITGMGVVCPIGVGIEAFWNSLLSGKSGVARLDWEGAGQLLHPFGGVVREFEPGRYVRPRKNLKVMSREIQMGVAAADMACTAAKVAGSVDPDRMGVVFGADMMVTELEELVGAYRACIAEGKVELRTWGEKALPEMFPLWMLKYLPNMPACHIGIAHDARGPNNTHTLGEVSGLTALAEACDVLRRGQADLMVAGAVSSRIHPLTMARYCALPLSRRGDAPAAACRPFDADRDGMVLGEGAAAFVLESRQRAEARGATPYARIQGFANVFEPSETAPGRRAEGIRRAIEKALNAARVRPDDIGHVNAHGLSTTEDDQYEAQAIRAALGDVPVTAPKSFFGNLGAGGGAVELAASVLALKHRLVPPTLNYERPDPACPIRVVHGEPIPHLKPAALALNHGPNGHAVGVVIGAVDG